MLVTSEQSQEKRAFRGGRNETEMVYDSLLKSCYKYMKVGLYNSNVCRVTGFLHKTSGWSGGAIVACILRHLGIQQCFYSVSSLSFLSGE